MCDSPVESNKYTLKVGTIVKIDGCPYCLDNEVVVSGYEEPRYPSNDCPSNEQAAQRPS